MVTLLSLSFAAMSIVAQQPGAASDQVQGAGQPQVAAEVDASATRAARPNTAPARDRQICRRHTRIGTLAGFESICHTEAEWRAIAAGTQSSYGQLQGTLGSTNDRQNSTQLRDRNGPF